MLQEEGDGTSEECGQVWEWHVSSQPVCLAWSPNATLRAAPRCLQVTLGSTDHKVTQLTSDLGDSHTAQVQCNDIYPSFVNKCEIW